ncbi:MAG: glycosyltransferase [Chitinophagaceae bacterium]|nr:MAG: glycosyltransferase [Chitinophagaceae bacterium]
MEIIIQILLALFYLLSGIVAFYLLLPAFLFIAYYLKGGLKKKFSFSTTAKQFEFAAIITAHQDWRFVAPFVDSFLKQRYKHFKVYVVADDCDTTELHFDDERIIVLKPEVALHSKIKSIQYAIDNFVNDPDVMIIFDSDNLVHPNYLLNLTSYYQQGFKVVQTHMLSKNIDTTYSRLDSVGHIYYTFFERKSKMALGLSSSILGLGISLDYNLYKEINYKDTVGGFDKKLQAKMAMLVRQIAFADDAIVYDEKVEEAAVMEKQRTRWIWSYFSHMKESWQLTWYGFKTMNVGRILLGATMLRPPMILLMSLLFALMLVSILIKPLLLWYWAGIVVIYVLVFILTIATQSYQKGMLQSLRFIPLLVISQFKSLLKIKKAKKNFLKTEHKKVIYIDELLKHEGS